MHKLLILLLSMFFLARSYGAQLAIVTSSKAIVYADQNLKTPIGYVRSGRRLKVGERKRRHGTILPIVVAGRIAYIRVKDISLNEIDVESDLPAGPQVTEHNIDKNFQTAEERISQNNYLVPSFNSFSLGEEWDDLSQEVNDEIGQNASSFRIMFEHRPPTDRLSWGIGLGYYKLTQNNAQFTTLTLEGNLFYNLVRTSILTVAPYAGLVFSGDAEVVLGDNFEKRAGVILGTVIGVQGMLFPYSKFGVVAGGSIKSFSLEGLDNLTLPNRPNQTITLEKLSGLNLYLGLSYRF